MWELLKTLYEVLGASYPKGSVAVAAVIGAFLFGGGWWLLGKQYEKQRAVGASPARIQVQPAGQWRDLTRERAPDTIYQNGTGGSIRVSVIVSSKLNMRSRAEAYLDSMNPPKFKVSVTEAEGDTTIQFEVPDRQYYKVSLEPGAKVIRWSEFF